MRGHFLTGRTTVRLVAAASACALSAGVVACGGDDNGGGASGSGGGGDVTVGLITKTETNPFFVKMKEGADAEAEEGGDLQSFAGKKTVTTRVRSRRWRT